MSVVTLAYHLSAATEAELLAAELRSSGYRPQLLECQPSAESLAVRLLATQGPLLLLVNDDFLHEQHCQEGLLDAYPTLAERPHFHPVMASSQRVGPDGTEARLLSSLTRVSDVIRYMNYWQNAYLTRRKALGSAAGEEGDLIAVRRISQEIGEVLRLIRASQPTDVPTLLNADVETIHALLGLPNDAEGVDATSPEQAQEPQERRAGPETSTAAAATPDDDADDDHDLPTESELRGSTIIVHDADVGPVASDGALTESPSLPPQDSDADTSPTGTTEDRVLASQHANAQDDAHAMGNLVSSVLGAGATGVGLVAEGIFEEVELPDTRIAAPALAAEDVLSDAHQTAQLPSAGESTAARQVGPRELDEAAIAKLDKRARKVTRARNLQTYLSEVEAGNEAAAERFAEAALAEDDGDYRLRYAYAVSLLERAVEDDRDVDDVADVIRPLFDSPLAAQTHMCLAQVSLQRKDLGTARKHLRKAFKLDAEVDPDLSYRLGALLQDEFDDERKRAARYLKHAARHSEANASDAHYRLGLIDWSLGRRRRAARRLRLALRAEPNHPFAAYDLACLYRERNRLVRARAYYDRAVATNPELETVADRAAFTPVDADGAPTRLPETSAEKFFEFVRERGKVEGAQGPVSSVNADAAQGPLAAAAGAATDTLTSKHFVFERRTPLAEDFGDEWQPLTVLITGASSGIGAACARRFAKAGHRLILTGRRVDRLRALSADLKRAYQTPIRLLSYDVGSYSAAEAMVTSLESEWAHVDVLLNNAGKALGLKPVIEATPREIDDMVDTNIKGVLYMTSLIGAGMVKRGRGHIINVCSTAGHEVYAGGTIYCATKHAVDAITRGTRLDLLQHGIRVSQVSPAAVEQTEFSEVRFGGDEQRAAKVYQGFQPLRAVDVAAQIFSIATAPAHVNVQDVIMQSTQQGNSTTVDRSGRERFATPSQV